MALKATIFKAELAITDLDRNYFETHQLTIARHPSENDARMMLRLLAFALNAHEHLEFTKGISTEDEPDIWQMDLTGDIDLWIDLGQPSEKRIRQACNKAKQVILYCYDDKSTPPWWQKHQGKTTRFQNLKVVQIKDTDLKNLETLAQRSMKLHLTIEGATIFIGDEQQTFEVQPVSLKA